MTRLVVRGVLRRLVVVPDATVRPFTSCDVPQRICSRDRTTIQPVRRNNAVPAFVFCCCAAVRARRGRPRGKRRASPGVGGAKCPCTPSTASRAPLPSKSALREIFTDCVVESWQNLRLAGRRRVESGAAEQGCYKEAFAHGLEEDIKRLMARWLGQLSVADFAASAGSEKKA